MIEHDTEALAPPAQEASAAPAVSLDTARQAVNDARSEMRLTLVERDREIDLIWLSLIARIHGLFIGVGGVAKSLGVDEAMKRVEGRKFSVLMRKDMPVNTLLGPISVNKLMQDVFEHVTASKLPEANAAVLDEIFKSNAVVLNALLKIINERKFFNGTHEIDVPLWSAFGASNELPMDTDLAAFRDRFAWTRIVEPVRTDDGFMAILRGQVDRNAGRGHFAQAPTVVKRSEIELLQHAASQVVIPDDVFKEVVNLRRKAEEENLHISARRYGEGLKLVQAKAILDGRTAVKTEDLTVLADVIWTDPEDLTKAAELCIDFAGQAARAAAKLREAFEPVKTELMNVRSAFAKDMADGTGSTTAHVSKFLDIQQSLTKVRKQVEKEADDARAANRDTAELDALLTEVKTAAREVRQALVADLDD